MLGNKIEKIYFGENIYCLKKSGFTSSINPQVAAPIDLQVMTNN